MPKQRRVSIAVRVNQAHPCAVPGCSQHRYSLSRWCSSHAAAAERNGDPLAQSIPARSWAPYRGLVRLIYTRHADHQGLGSALAWLDAWMQEAVAKDGSQPWASEVARLHRHGCTPLGVLVELAAVWCWLQQNPRATRSDAHRDFTTSKAVLGLAPRPRRFTARPGTGGSSYVLRAKPAALRQVGPRLVQALAPLLVTTLEAIHTQDARARAKVDAMRVPFGNPTHQAIERAAQAITQESYVS